MTPQDIYEETADKLIPASDIAGMVMANALINTLRETETTEHLTERKRKIILRQIAKQIDRLLTRYSLDIGTLDLSQYTNAEA